MIRTFLLEQDANSALVDSIALTELNLNDIENAGLREVLQTPHASYNSWTILEALLQPSGDRSPFIFCEPLGQSREVKVALSGLFGRFVARAYLEQHFAQSLFVHPSKHDIVVDGRRKIKLVRQINGDLPDWVTYGTGAGSLSIVEAKGCHDPEGPHIALARAWAQADRVRVCIRSQPITSRKIAIATRWGSAWGGSPEVRMAVREESAPGVALNEAEENALHLGLQRLSKAVELRRLGHPELADALRALAEADNSLAEQQAAVLAREALHKSRGINSNLRTETISVRDLVGGIVTRVGHINAPELSRADQDTLDRLGFRPMFAGVERNLLEALIQGNSKNMSRILNASARKDGMARGGTWVVPLGRKREQRKLRRIGRDSVASEK